MKINDLMKHRSVTSCMKEAYCLMSNNTTELLKSTWWAFVTYAFMLAFMIYLRTPNKTLHDWGEENMMLSFCLQTIVYLGAIIAAFLTGATVWCWITDKPFVCILKRSITMYLLSGIASIVVVFVATIAFAGVSLMTGNTATVDSPSLTTLLLYALTIAIAIVLYMVACLPFAYMSPRYILLENGEKFRLWKSFKCGIRNMGSIFKLGILGFLVILVTSIPIYMPLSFLIGAQVTAQLGTLEGDTVGIPSYFTFLFIATTTLLLFVFTYITHWLLISYVYLYGSIENDEMKKAELRKKEKEENIKE